MFRSVYALAFLFSFSPFVRADEADGLDFERDVFPILRDRCLKCHGPKRQRSELRLDSRASILRGGDSGSPAVVPGRSSESTLYRRLVTEDREARMPPTGDPLRRQEIDLLQRWIDQGARMPQRWTVSGESPASAGSDEVAALDLGDHWSFQPIGSVQPPAPAESSGGWGVGAVDAFVARRLAKAGLGVSPEADRETLIRRLYLVLHGLPPTLEEIDAFVGDASEHAYENLVERALESPRYGERWARHWLDLVRFGETTGFEVNRERPNAWHYRDYVIESFNSDKAYDEFLREQIAGDALGVDVGTGFLVAGPYDQVKSPDINLTLMQRQDELADIINTTGTAFLGLTLGCARCHDHKFDPISQNDYYSIQAVFAGVQHGERAIARRASDPARAEELREEAVRLRRSLEPFLDVPASGYVWIEDGVSAAHDRRGISSLRPPRGSANHRTGSARGNLGDAGGPDRPANVSDGSYTWWENRPAEFLVSYRLLASGRFRVWASWGTGWRTHTRDAEYVLDIDGDLTTSADQQLLAKIDQQSFASGDQASGDVPLWSGLRDLGVFDVEASSVLAIRGGETGTAVTADLVVLGPVEEGRDRGKQFRLRPRVSAQRNVETFPPREAKFVRFTIEATLGGAEPCIDELEIWSGGKNVALAANGARARSSGDYPNNAFHKLEHIFDGRYGNSYSWISSEREKGWVEIELPRSARIERIEWARDRERKYGDRLATRYRIEAALEPGKWELVAGSSDRIPVGRAPVSKIGYRFDRVSLESAARGKALLTTLRSTEKALAAIEERPVAYVGKFSQPGPTHRLYRGEPLQKREEVAPNTVLALGKLGLAKGTPEQQRRVAFARWITRPDNPLTARVIVNRLWQHTFGVGIVDTPSDFGQSGTPPTHPELLDWLAGELIRSDWSLKHVQRRLVLSSAFRQSSRPREKALRADAGTRLLWRFPPRRLEAEAIRDSILHTSGVLDLRMGGPGFSAFEVQLENVRHYFPKKDYGPADWRRMIYMTKVRQEQDSVFGVFDCPDASQVMPERSRSTTPLQALSLFNSRFVLQQSDLFAERLRAAHPEDERAQVERAFRRAFGRRASQAEALESLAFVRSQGLEALCRALLNANEFVFIL